MGVSLGSTYGNKDWDWDQISDLILKAVKIEKCSGRLCRRCIS